MAWKPILSFLAKVRKTFRLHHSPGHKTVSVSDIKTALLSESSAVKAELFLCLDAVIYLVSGVNRIRQEGVLFVLGAISSKELFYDP